MSLLPCYTQYRSSGSYWLGDIPEDWEAERLKFVADLAGDKVSPAENQRYVGMENVSSGTGRHVGSSETIPDGLSVAFRSNDVLFGKLRPYLAKSWLAQFDGICSSEFLVLRTERLAPRFLNYVTLSREFVNVVDSSTYGAKMPRASWDFIGLLKVPMPGLELSQRIAKFLDYETAKIDALIDKQQQLIALLKEKRQAVISHAVTKGLDPNAPLKDSGVEWLGEVPAHWAVAPFRHVFELANGQVDPARAPYSEMPLIAPNHIESGSGRLLGLESAREQGAISGKYEVNAGEIIYSKIRPALRKAVLAPVTCLCSADMYALRPTGDNHAPFLLRVLLSEYFSDTVVLESLRVAMPKVNRETLGPIYLAIPPPAEQREIVAVVEQQIAKLDELVGRATESMELLNERRTALISAAVTGKIDVRGWKAPEGDTRLAGGQEEVA